MCLDKVPEELELFRAARIRTKLVPRRVADKSDISDNSDLSVPDTNPPAMGEMSDFSRHSGFVPGTECSFQIHVKCPIPSSADARLVSHPS